MKTYIALFIFLCFYSTTFAQEKGDIELGADIGLNQATVSTNQLFTNIGYRIGVNFGVSGDYYFSDRWSIKGKIIYDQKGWSDIYDNTDYKLNYITIPIMANWHFGRKRNWYLNFGPYVGFLTSASETSDGADIKSSFNNTDVGLALGIGVKIPISENVKFFIESQGQGGFTNIFNGSTASSNPSAQNSSGGLNIGVVFTLGDPHLHKE